MGDLITNPRFLAYMRSQGMNEEELKARDGHLWLYEFICWNRARLIDYSKVNPQAFTCGGLTEHDTYNAWLEESFP